MFKNLRRNICIIVIIVLLMPLLLELTFIRKTWKCKKLVLVFVCARACVCICRPPAAHQFPSNPTKYFGSVRFSSSFSPTQSEGCVYLFIYLFIVRVWMWIKYLETAGRGAVNSPSGLGVICKFNPLFFWALFKLKKRVFKHFKPVVMKLTAPLLLPHSCVF